MTDAFSIHTEAASVVLLGSFNPAIVTPWWLVHQGLLSADAAEDVSEIATLPRLSVFEAGWLRCETTDDRLTLMTSDVLEYTRLRDLVMGILKTLPHVPVGAMGINRQVHFAMPTPKSWHRVGDQMVSKQFWEQYLNLPGMRSLTVEGVRQDSFAGAIRVRTEPSNAVPLGVFVEHNDHYVLRHVTRQAETREEMFDPKLAEERTVEPSSENIEVALQILTVNYDKSLASALDVAKAIAAKGI